MTSNSIPFASPTWQIPSKYRNSNYPLWPCMSCIIRWTRAINTEGPGMNLTDSWSTCNSIGKAQIYSWPGGSRCLASWEYEPVCTCREGSQVFCFFACLLLIRLLFDNCSLVDSIFCLLLSPSCITLLSLAPCLHGSPPLIVPFGFVWELLIFTTTMCVLTAPELPGGAWCAHWLEYHWRRWWSLPQRLSSTQ